MTFQLGAYAKMLWRDKPIGWRASRLKEMGFGEGLWNWPDHDLARLKAAGVYSVPGDPEGRSKIAAKRAVDHRAFTTLDRC